MKVPSPTSRGLEFTNFSAWSDDYINTTFSGILLFRSGAQIRELHLPSVECKYLCCNLLLGKTDLILCILLITAAPYRLNLNVQQTLVATYLAKNHFNKHIQVLMSEIVLVLWTHRKHGTFFFKHTFSLHCKSEQKGEWAHTVLSECPQLHCYATLTYYSF